MKSTLAIAAGAALWAVPAHADVKAGVDAWSRGDFARAVAEWREPAARGDADALFNLAQAYRLGRGVPADLKQAEVYYAKAAEKGHLKAADNYGLLLFQDGRRGEAIPYVRAAADRGDPRAQYLLGIAHFNGDLVPKDWVRAYALMTLANGAGLPQAVPAIQKMDSYIPLDQRQKAQSLASQIKQQTDARRSSQLAAADLQNTGGASGSVPSPIQSVPPRPSRPYSGGAAGAASGAAQAAAASSAGADYSRPPTPAAQPRPSAGQSANGGPWRVQLGAFSVRGNADKLWRKLSGRRELQGATKKIVPSGRVSKLQAAGYASRAEADKACSSLKRSGYDCVVTR